MYPLLAGLGTIADRMLLLDDNRIFAKHLYYNLEQSENPFFQYYAEKTRELSREKAVNQLIPLLTLGRDKNGAHLGAEIILEKDISKIEKLYYILEQRVHESKEQTQTIRDLMEKEYRKNEGHCFRYYDQHHKIPVKYLGVATSYITDTYRIPSLVITGWEDDVLTAEARAPAGFNWLDCLRKIEPLLIQYGGHKEAAGFTCHAKSYPKIDEKFHVLAEEQYKNIKKLQKESKKVFIDYVLDADQLDVSRLREINRIFAPFGEGNPPLAYLMIDVDSKKLYDKGFRNIPEVSENEGLNIIFSIIDREFTITDHEIISKKYE